MIVTKIDSHLFGEPRKWGLPLPGKKGSRIEPGNQEKSFEHCLMEAFEGELVQEKELFSTKLSPLTRDNLLRLSQV